MSSTSSPQNSRRRTSNDTNSDGKRVHVACNRCRKRRTRCDGNAPQRCSFCVSRRKSCEYADVKEKITIDKVQYDALMARQRTGSLPSQDQESDDESVTGSLPGSMAPNREGFPGPYRGPTSSINWALLFQDLVNPNSRNFDRELQMENPTYNDATWIQRESSPSQAQIESYENAKELFDAQYQYIGTIFSFCSPQDFERRLKCVLYENPKLSHREERLAYAQVYLIVAYGLLYSVNRWGGADGPPGFEHFKKALELLPDLHEEGSVLFVEVLSLVGYYLQILNRRDAAFLYIGLALRMAISLGMHQEPSDPNVEEVEMEHRRRVWWSVYSMDRILCVKSGNPITISDQDVDVAYPSPMNEIDVGDSPARVLSHYSQLSKILGEIGEDIYRKKRKSGSTLVKSVLRIMSELKTWFANLPEELRIDFNKLDLHISREAVSTHLHYFSCINMTVRPLLFHVIQRRMEAVANGTTSEDWKTGLSKNTVLVIEKSVAAARDSTKIMAAAAQRGLVATYGFMDGEHAFSAALVLVMVNAAFPKNRRDAEAMDSALAVLKDMARKGNSHIRARRDLLLDLLSSNRLSGPTDSQASLSQVAPASTQPTLVWNINALGNEEHRLLSPPNEEFDLEDFPLDFNNMTDDMMVWNNVSMDLDAIYGPR